MMIYILEFERPIGNLSNPKGQARFYLGYCDDSRLSDRLSEHKAGKGAALTRYAVAAGIGFVVAATLPGTKEDERRLKRQKNTPRIVSRLRKSEVKS